jgi:hypothetical protein
MRKRKLLVMLVGLAVLAAGAFVLWRPGRIARENFFLMRVGMTKAEVEALLGAEKNQTTGEIEFEQDGDASAEVLGEPPPPYDLEYNVSWSGDWTFIQVHFDPAGNVTGARCNKAKPIDRGPFGNIVWRAKRQWRRWFPETIRLGG